MSASGWLSIGEAAVLLRMSRRHVVGLCARGLLPYVTVGQQRRVRRIDVEALIKPALSRTDLEQLWLHTAIAGKFIANPAALLAVAAINLRRLRRLHRAIAVAEWLDRWQIVLDAGPTAVLDALTSPSEYAVALRGTSPFVGILSEVERRSVLKAFVETRGEQARPVRPETLDRVLRAV